MKNLELYDELVSKCDRFERKGKTMPYTSANGYMFSILNKDGELGIRFSKEKQKEYLEKYDTSHFTSYGAVMKGYLLINDKILENKQLILDLLSERYDFVMTLDPK